MSHAPFSPKPKHLIPAPNPPTPLAPTISPPAPPSSPSMPTWIEIDCAALRHNYAALAALCAPAQLIPIVKANAYGCGAPECARLFAAQGAALLAVTRADEALQLREAGIQTPILTLAPALPADYETLVRHDITLAIASLQEATALSEWATKLQRPARAHLKINTGMNRFGAAPETVAEIIGRARKLPGLQITGAFSHLANASAPDAAATLAQAELWKDATHGLRDMTLHLANSSALVRFAALRGAAVRAGTLLYGQFPDPLIAKLGAQAGLQLRDPFAVKTHVLAIQKLAPGARYGYGGEWVAPRASTLAILDCGWADGLTLEPNARAQSPLDAVKSGFQRAVRLKKNPNAGRTVQFGERRANLVGRVAMQTCAADVTELGEVQVGDIATVSMRRLAAREGLQRVYVN